MITPLIEKIRPIAINTDISPEAIEASNEGNRVLVNPVIDCLNRHYYTSETGDSLKSENIKGTTLVSNSLPSGDNVCIGTYEDRLNNKLIFWNFNSNDDHGVYAYSPETGLITELLQVDGLDFQNDRRYLVTGAGSIGNLLYWSDGINPERVINMTRDYSYGTFSLTHITVIKPHPITRVNVGENQYYESPNLDRTYDSAIKTNLITDKNFQFSYRYKYLDNEYSVIAPYSNLSFADFVPDKFNATATESESGYVYNNKVRVRITVPTTPNAFIKNVELLVRENNTGNWKIWKTIISLSTNIDVYFTNSEATIDVDQTETAKLFEAVPNFAKALAVTKNRLFISADQEGFDVNDSPTITLTEVVINATSSTSASTIIMTVGSKTFVDSGATTYVIGERIRLVSTVNTARSIAGIVTAISGTSITFYVDTVTSGSVVSSWTVYKIKVKVTSPNVSPADFNKTFFKTNGVYIFSLAVFDEDQRCMGVISKTQFNATGPSANNSFNTSCLNDILVKAVLTGNFAASPKIKYVSLAVTKEQVYLEYVQIAARPLFYQFDKVEGYAVQASQIEIEGRVYAKNPTDNTQFNRIFLQTPKEMPFVVDKGHYVRLLDTSLGTSRVNKVLDVIEDFIVISDFDVSVSNITEAVLIVEVFKPKTTQNDGLFYEVTDRYPVDNSGIISKTTFDYIYGDTYRPNHARQYQDNGFRPNQVDYIPQNYRAFKLPVPPYFRPGIDIGTETLFNPEMPTPTVVTSVESVVPQIYGVTSIATAKRLYIPDYQKIAYNQGKTIVEVQDKKAFQRTSVVRFSNKFVQDTNINGMSSFDTGNQYPLAYDRGPIIKLQPIANRMLAIHERATTVLYLNEKMIKTADGADQLIATGDTIGYDSQLEGNFGCYHPESIVKVEDDVNAVFGFDIYKGVAWRYTLEGQYPISNYGRKQYFRDKANAYIGNKNGVKIIGGHDPFHKEYIITFNDGTGESETIAFNYVKNLWTKRYAFVPEYYGKINNKLIGFKNGELWLHNSSSTYNNFYGVQYESFLKIAANPHPTKEKVALGVDLALESVSIDIDYKQIEITTPEGQYSYLKSDEFEKKENVYYADILRDVNTPAVLIEAGKIALRDGDEIRSKYFLVQINDDKTTKNTLQMVNLNYIKSDYSE